MNILTVLVNTSSGTLKKGVKVNYEVGGGISCIGGGSPVYTDNTGRAVITWSLGCKCTYIYINGKAYKGNYANGGSYTFRN